MGIDLLHFPAFVVSKLNDSVSSKTQYENMAAVRVLVPGDVVGAIFKAIAEDICYGAVKFLFDCGAEILELFQGWRRIQFLRRTLVQISMLRKLLAEQFW